MKRIKKLMNKFKTISEVKESRNNPTDVQENTESSGNRYANDWNAYSKSWGNNYGPMDCTPEFGQFRLE